MKFCLIILLCLAMSGVNAQNYVITTRMDTVRGETTIQFHDRVDKVLLTANNKKTLFEAFQVLMLFHDSVVYKPVRTVDAIRFMRVARSGLVSLCYYRQSPGSPYNIPYLVKLTGESLEVNNLLFKKSVSRFLEDCASMRQKLKDESLGRNDLEKIIDEYNRCLEKQTKVAFTPSGDPKLTAISELNKKISLDAAVPADVTEILKGIYGKVKDGLPVPNYLTDGLREVLKGFPVYREDVENLIELLNKP